jgi:predicted alpha/beta-hydrolase family hydrolase
MPTTELIEVSTPEGPGRFHLAAADHARALLVLGHGAGGGVDAVDLSVLASRLPREGIAVARFEQPWRLAGKKVAAPPPRLDIAWNAALPTLLDRYDGLPVVTGGRSAGARVACRTAPEHPRVAGVVCCAFPLHPPGRPDSSRLEELTGAGVPTFVVQGERDPFGAPDEFPDNTPMAVIPQADHGFAVPKRAALDSEQTMALIVESVVEWISARIA